MVRRKPNLFVIGSMKSGTSSLCMHLSEHPAIFMSPVKEPEHFSRAENFCHRSDRYLGLFQGASTETYLAEGSTEYTKRPSYDGVAERIHAFNPDARFVYVMRHPFDRVVSHYRHQIRKGLEKEPLPAAIKRPSAYLPTSYYAYQLRPYLQLFGRDSIFLDTFESFTASPVSFCARLFEWLGIDPSVVPPSAGQRLNASPMVLETHNERSLPVRVARRVNRYLRQHPGLGRIVPDHARRWYRDLLPKTSCRQADSAEFSREVETAHRAVQPLLADWIAELEEMTGRCFEEWRSLKMGPGHCESAVKEEVWLPEGVLKNSARRGVPLLAQPEFSM